MAARVVELMEAIASYLATPGLTSFTYNVVRQNPAFVNLEETNFTTIYVYPQSLAKGIDTREDFNRIYTINVHITNYLDADEIDQAMELAEQIENALENQNFADFAMLQFTSELNGRNPYEIQSITDRRYFHVPISVQYWSVP